MEWGFLNWAVVIIYLLLTFLFATFFFANKNNSIKEFFLAGGKVPSIVTALSIYATILSPISYMAIPASVYRNGIIVGITSLGTVILLLFVAYVIVPFYRKINVITGYEYLEKRFSAGFKYVSSLSFILFHIIRIAIVLFLPVLALQVVFPDSSVITMVLISGLLVVAYSSIGGMSGILWSDAIQAVIFIIGMILIIIVGFQYIPEQGLFAALKESGKGLTADHFSFTLGSKDNFWASVIGAGIFSSIYGYVASQDVFQRYNVTKNVKEAQKSLLFNIPLLFLSVVLISGVGAAFIIFFNYSGNTLPPEVLKTPNSILPYFVFNFLPVGISGLVIAALLAAAQSTVSSSINAVTTCVVNDFIYQDKTDVVSDKQVKVAKIVSWIIGFLGIFLTFYFIKYGQGDLFKSFIGLISLVGAPIAGLFLVGIFIKRVGSVAAALGLGTGIAISFWISNPLGLGYAKPGIHAFMYSPVIILSVVIVAYLTSFIFKNVRKDQVDGLTYYTVE